MTPAPLLRDGDLIHHPDELCKSIPGSSVHECLCGRAIFGELMNESTMRCIEAFVNERLIETMTKRPNESVGIEWCCDTIAN